MIEATLDRNLLQQNPKAEATHTSVLEASAKIQEPMKFQDYIQKLREFTGLNQQDVEASFWELIDNGDLSLSSDFTVTRRG